MHSSSFGRRLAALAALAAFSVPMVLPRVALADDASDPNAPGVARISIVQGSVAVQRGDSAAPVEAAVNAPVLGADYITTGDNARAEVQFDEVSSVRLGDNVQMRFTRIDPGDRELQLAEGTIEVRLLRGDDGTATVDTPSISVRSQSGGSYRVSVDANGQTSVTVRDGSAEILTPQGQQTLQPGTTLVANGTASDPRIDTVQAIAMDGFDAFNQDCDAHEQVALSDSHDVAPQVQGVADLDADGRWVDDTSAGYGEVWVPSDVPADWAPYRDGRWAWEDAYGWTWIGAEPWGWAPYHYGRWYHSAAYGWAWTPGAYAPWAPAYVAFFGFNVGGVDINLGFGNIGWLPIGPREAFHPWWGRGYAFRDVAVINNYTVINNYRNARWGITSVSHERFLSGNFGHPEAMSPERLRDARFTSGRLALVPTAASLRYTDREVSLRQTPRTAFAERSFAGHAQPVARIPFEQQRTAVATGRTIERPSTGTAAFRGEGTVQQRGAGTATFSQRGEGSAAYQQRGTGTATYQQRTEGSSAYQQRTEGSSTYQQRTEGGAAYQQRGYTAPANGRTDVNRTANDPWSRFNASRGTSTGNAGAARGYQAPARGAVTTGAGAYGRTDTNGRVQTYDGARTTNAYPSRVQTYDGARSGDNTPQRSYAAPQRSWTTSQPSSSAPQRSYNAPSYSAPQRSYNAQPSYSAPQRSYNAPTYSAPQRSYSAPQRSYNAPAYSAPQRSYSAPQRSYNAPTYSAPQRSYSAPQRSYSAPQRSYSAPQRSYSAPQRGAPAQQRSTSRPAPRDDSHNHG